MKDQSVAPSEHPDAASMLIRATGKPIHQQDMLVVSDEPADVTSLVRACPHVLHLSDRHDGPIVGAGVVRRPLAGPDPVVPARSFSLAWVRYRGNPTDVLQALDALLPGGIAAIAGERAAMERLTTLVRERGSANAVRSMPAPTEDGAAPVLVCSSTAVPGEDVDPDCHFCPPRRFTLNGDVGLPGASGVLWGDDDYFVIPDLAPLVSGHLLIVDRRHRLSMACGSQRQLTALKHHADRVRRLFCQAYGCDAVFLEHGAMFPHDAGSCIDHAHWHCVPVAAVRYSISRKLNEAGYRSTSIVLDRLLAARQDRQSYLLVREGDKTNLFPIDGTQCQFLRFHLAEATNGARWLWHHTYDSAPSRALFCDTLSRALSVAHLI